MNRAAFYDYVRPDFPGNELSVDQVKRIDAVLDALETRDVPIMHAAYILGTAHHESDLWRTMEEYASGAAYEGRKELGNTVKGDGRRFKGRGLVQVTGRRNYADWSRRLGIDLVKEPQLAAELPVAVSVLIDGMLQGTFTGKKLADFASWRDMRRVVNGMDKAAKIAGHAGRYEAALKAAGYGGVAETMKPVAQVEIIAMGSNDFDRPQIAAKNVALAVGNALARGRKAVVVVPNADNPKIAAVAAAVFDAALQAGAVIEQPLKWSPDGLHPADYRVIARAYPGAIVRGDSFAVGIFNAQDRKHILSWGEVGASSQRVIAAIEKLDGAILLPVEPDDEPEAPKPAPTPPNAPAPRHWLASILAMLFGKDR